MDRIRVASMQYYIRPVRAFEQFADQVGSLVETAKDYKCQLAVFPEYFTVQLLTLGDVKRPIQEQIRDLSKQVPRYMELMSGLARKHKMYICAGTIPVHEPDDDRIYNECFFFSPKGEYGIQGKVHMTRFEDEEWMISPRGGLKIFETAFGKVVVLICYDVEFPENVRALALAGADLVLVPTALMAPYGFIPRAMVPTRAYENQVFLAYANRCGREGAFEYYGESCVIGPDGAELARAGAGEALITADLDRERLAASRALNTYLPDRRPEIYGALARPAAGPRATARDR